MENDCKINKSEKNNENLRVVLQISYDRINQLNNIIQLTNGLIVTIFIGFFTIFPLHEPSAILFCILILILWRVYVRELDDEIIEQYGKIISCERELDIPDTFALVTNLIKRFPKNRKSEYESINLEAKYEELPYLIKTKQVSHRLHNWFDLIAIMGIWFLIIELFNEFNIEVFFQKLWYNFALFFIFFVGWWIIENIFIVRNPPPVSNLNLRSLDKIIGYSQFAIYFFGHIIGALLILMTFIVIISFDVFLIIISSQLPFYPFFPIYLLSFTLICIYGLGSYANNIPIKTKKLINEFPNQNPLSPHHAIIIAHKKPSKQNGNYDDMDYSDGIDILINKFRKSQPRINYQIYEVGSREEVVPIIMNNNTTHLWIFGHGKRHKLRLFQGDLNYYDLKTAPKKEFIGQYHCNGLFWKSLADYNNPDKSDVTWWLRNTFSIRISVRKKLIELGI